jgi:hypothetical protein
LKPAKSAAQRADQIQETFNWTVQTTELISRLDHRLSSTIEAWKMFNAADGDFRYFTGMSQQRARLYLPEIKVAFEGLQALHIVLVNLEKSCHQSMKLVRAALT